MHSADSPGAVAELSPPAARRRWRDLRRSTRLCVLGLSLLLLTVFLELAFRGYWQAAKKVPAFRTGRIWESYFAELADVNLAQAPTTHADGTFDVLVLGASVWH